MKNSILIYILLIALNSNAYSQLSELIKISDVIVEGKVIKKESKWNETNTLISTFYSIEIESVFRGQKLQKEIIVSRIGGTVDNSLHFITHQQSINEEKKGYFFMKNSSDGYSFSDKEFSFIEVDQQKRNVFINGENISISELENEIINNVLLPKYTFEEYIQLKASGFSPDVDTCDILPLYRDGRHSIEFKFDNVRFSNDTNKIDFDLMVKSSTPGLKFGKGNLFVRYTKEFGSNVVSNSSVTIEKGSVLSNPLYTIDYNDRSSNSILISIDSPNPNSSLHTFGSDFEPFVQISIDIKDYEHIGNISFDDLDVFGEIEYWCQGSYETFNEIILDDPINTAQFGTPIGLTYTFENLTVNSFQDEMDVDLFARASSSSNYSDAFIYIDYNELGFGENVVSNGLTFIQSDFLAELNEYEVFLSDFDNNTIQMVIFHASEENFVNLATTPEKLGTFTFPVNDCEENKDLNFDLITISSDHTHYTGQMPIPYALYSPVIADDEETGSICGCSKPIITSFSPSTIRAGTGEILTINGSNFGQFSESESTVLFNNGDLNGTTEMEAGARDFEWDNVIHWTDNKIEIKVPSTDKFEGTENPASTGEIKVKNSCDISDKSDETLFIPYSLLNTRVGEVSGRPFKLTLKGEDEDGICFRFTSDTPTWIRLEFADAVNNWCNTTGINFYIGEEVPAGTEFGEDGKSIVKYFNTGLGGGMIINGIYFSPPCTTDEFGFPFSEIDITVSGPQNPPDGFEQKMEELLTHELGHAHMLGHASGLSPTNQPLMRDQGNQSGGLITPNDDEGANLVFANSANIVVGSCGVPIGQGSCNSSCSTNSVYDESLAEIIKINPNPSGTGIINVYFDDERWDHAEVTLFTVSGVKLWSDNIIVNRPLTFNLPEPSGTYYVEFSFNGRRYIEKVIKL